MSLEGGSLESSPTRRARAGGDYLLEVAFIEARLRAVEHETRAHCASLAEEHSDAAEDVRQACRVPYGEEEPIERLPVLADARLLRLKRERALLEWLRQAVARVPLSLLLHAGPLALLDGVEAAEADEQRVGYTEEYWELRHSAETLRLLSRLWAEWRGSSAGYADGGLGR